MTAESPVPRPSLHFTAESGWINDPHGITYRNGQYEVFYQYVPGQTVWGPNCHWGHAVGPDLMSLREAAVAIAPGDGDGGIWTGSLITDDGGDARIFYTSTSVPDFSIGRIRVATPDDDAWDTWRKGDFVVDAPHGLDLVAFRDPFVRREGDRWRMFVGAARADGTAMALSYTSDDLATWHYAGVALERSSSETEPIWMGALWECPQVFELDGRAVMLSSVWDADVLHYAAYAIGTCENGVFDAESWGRLTYGDSYYAPSLFTDAEGRTCVLFWMRGIGDPDRGWEGAHSVPYVLALDGDTLIATPHPDLDGHRVNSPTGSRTAGLAADITWTNDADGDLVVESASAEVLRLRRRGDELELETEGVCIRAPAIGDVRVILDGPVSEVSSSAGLIGVPTSPVGADLTIAATAGVVRVSDLA